MARLQRITLGFLCRRSSELNVSRHVQSSSVIAPHTSPAEERVKEIMKGRWAGIQANKIDVPFYSRTSENSAFIRLVETGDKDLLDFSKNSYLGLGRHPEVVKAAHEALDEYGVGIGSVRCAHGTFTLHNELENKLTEFMERDPEYYDTVVFPTGYHSNLALFHILAGSNDVIIYDSLIHGTAIHGMALSKAKKEVFENNDMEDLERKLQANMDKRQRIIAADGVYSMQGYCAKLKEMRILADQYDALLMIDDAHGVGVVGEEGKGSEEHENAMNSCNIITASLCKGLTPTGGFVMANRPLIHMLRFRSGSYVFSTALTPSNTAAVMKALEIARSEEGYRIRAEVRKNASLFRKRMKEANFIVEGDDVMPICPVIFPNDSSFTLQMAKEMLDRGILTLGVTFPSAPFESPRIRVVIAGFHTEDHVNRLVDAFIDTGNKLGRTQ